MDKNSSACLWGDCPGLDRSPRSAEHDKRFQTQHKAVGQMIANTPADAINGSSAQNSKV